MLENKKLTYISLFSCAGVGCYGFKQAGFECIATNEIIERRLNVQRINNKCKYETGYICDDITTSETKNKIFNEIKKWKRLGNDRVDVLIATPPCQGMSVANHKKNKKDIKRNSLVVESIELIKEIKPRFFIFENVPAFMKTGCTTPDGDVKAIGDVIFNELGDDYIITSRILNFKNYGSNSSRKRTVVIGVCKELSEYIAPVELYPEFVEEKTLKEVIGDLPKLEWGEIYSKDFYHSFRTYPEEMRCWVHGLKEGESAFDNKDEGKRPHRVVDGVIIPNKNKNGDKYTRQFWNKVAPCIHTRNDQLASQNTIHPVEDRVFSIRELMKLMTIPDSFKWVDYSLGKLNKLDDENKRRLLKKEEVNIRQSIGEAVPTTIFNQIAKSIKKHMEEDHLSNREIKNVIEDNQLNDIDSLIGFIRSNPNNLCKSTLARIAELANSKRENNAAYYTNKFIINEIYNQLPKIEKDEINVLEPSVGVGNFIPFILKKYEDCKMINIDVVDIDKNNIRILKHLLRKYKMPNNVKINYITDDTLKYNFDKKYDLAIGNPPFAKLSSKEAEEYKENNYNKITNNTFEFFLEKTMKISDYVVMITPKALLNTPEFCDTRELLEKKRVFCIQDFGEKGFKGVLVETICLFVDTTKKPSKTLVESITLKKRVIQKQQYITEHKFPYWIIYRDSYFDKIAKKMDFNCFTVFRDRQITNSNTVSEKKTGYIRVLKSRNISDDGSEILNIPGYDSYIKKSIAKQLSAYKFFNRKNVYLTPNMTYKPRIMKNSENIIVNGSVAVLVPKKELTLTRKQMKYFASKEYRNFYKIARNYQTRSLNVDATSVFFYGILKEKKYG